jgi:hypothetical protein
MAAATLRAVRKRFDGTGLDTAVPDAVFVSVVPATLVALPPAALAAAFDGRRRGLSVGAVVWVAAVGVSVLTVDALRVCAC